DLRRGKTNARTATSVRLRRRAALVAPPWRLRRRAHGLVPVLPAARGGRVTPPQQLSPCRRLARGLVTRVLAPLRRQSRRDDRLARPATVPAPPPSRLLLLTDERRSSCRGGIPRETHGARALRRPDRAHARRARRPGS